jgi:hypothetical protein
MVFCDSVHLLARDGEKKQFGNEPAVADCSNPDQNKAGETL